MDKDLKDGLLVYVGVLILGIGIWVGCSYFEMKSFNKFTEGKKASLTDAMFVKLRVMAK